MAKAKEDESKSKRCSVCSHSRVQCMFTISNVRSQYRERRIQIANMCRMYIFQLVASIQGFVIETVELVLETNVYFHKVFEIKFFNSLIYWLP